MSFSLLPKATRRATKKPVPSGLTQAVTRGWGQIHPWAVAGLEPVGGGMVFGAPRLCQWRKYSACCLLSENNADYAREIAWSVKNHWGMKNENGDIHLFDCHIIIAKSHLCRQFRA